MNPKSARIAFYRASVLVLSLSLFITKTEAQMIGHLGVATEPIPLVQAKRPQRKLVTRNLNRPNPASKDLQADINSVGGATGKPNQNSASANSGSSSGTLVAVVTPPKNSPPVKPVEAKPTPTIPAKPAVSPFDESLAKAEALLEKAKLKQRRKLFARRWH